MTALEEAWGDVASAWDESKHPREPEGTEVGGQFRSLYHVSPVAHRQEIYEKGLVPDAKKRYSDSGPGVYTFGSRDEAWRFATTGERMYGDSDIWEVKNEGLDLQRDPFFEPGHPMAERAVAQFGGEKPDAFVTQATIPPEQLTLHPNPWHPDPVTEHRLVTQALQSWVGDPSTMRIHMADEVDGVDPSPGPAERMRDQAAALLQAVREGGANDKRLYRGAVKLDDGTGHALPESWTESRAVASAWAKKYKGQVFTLEPGHGRGVRMRDYIQSGQDVNSEKQWLIDPLSRQAATAAAWDESKHPRDPGGEGGGQWISNEEQDTSQQKAILKTNKIAQKVRGMYPAGQRVEAKMTGEQGTVARHVPGNNAQGGSLTVKWDNGATGRHPPSGIKPLDDPATPWEEQAWVDPPKPRGIHAGIGGAGGYTTDRAETTLTEMGREGEALFREIAGDSELLHPPGAGEQSPLDVQVGDWGFEVKSVDADSTSFKATPKKYEIASKEAYAKEHGLTPAIAIVVIDRKAGKAQAYYREGLKGGRLSERTGWKYMGETKLDQPVPLSGRAKIHVDLINLRNSTSKSHQSRIEKRINANFNHMTPEERAAADAYLKSLRGSAWASLTGDGWDESEHPRHPRGHPHGGEFRSKMAGEEPFDLPEEMQAKEPRHRIKVGEAKNFREELGQWYWNRRHGDTGPGEVMEPWGSILDNWGNWTMSEMYALRNELQKQLREKGAYVNGKWVTSGLLSGEYAQEIGRSLSQARNEAKRILAAVDKEITIQQFGLEQAQELYPELFAAKTTAAKKIAPRDQGIPEDYLTEKGTFKPGYDAKLKSDLVNSVVDLYPTKRVLVPREPMTDTKSAMIESWKRRNPRQVTDSDGRPWTDEEIWPAAKADLIGLEPDIYDRYMKETRTRVAYEQQSTLIHRFDEATALRILGERGWMDHLAKKEQKLGLTPATPNRESVVSREIVDRAWGDNVKITGWRYAEIQLKVQNLSHIPADVVAQLKERGMKVYIGPAEASTDLDEMQSYADEKGSGRGWKQTNLANVPAWYSPSDKTAIDALMSKRGGSVAVTAHETGHGIGHLLGMDNSDRLHEYHKQLYSKLRPYFQQGGSGGSKGKKELWAEGVAVSVANRRNKALGLPEIEYSGPFKSGQGSTEAAREYYAWVDSVLDRLGSLRTPSTEGTSVAPDGYRWVHDSITGLNVLEKR